MAKRRESVDHQLAPLRNEECFFSLIDRMYEEQGFELLGDSVLGSKPDEELTCEV